MKRLERIIFWLIVAGVVINLISLDCWLLPNVLASYPHYSITRKNKK
jgi:hypothetical protein